MSIEVSQFKLDPAAIVPPGEPEAQAPRPSTALAPRQETVPALPPSTVRTLLVADYALPGAAGSAWLLSLGLAFSQSASLPLLAALTAAGIGSGLAIARSLIMQKTAAPVATDPAMAQTHYNYAIDLANTAKLRLEHAYKYVCLSDAVPGDQAERLLKDLPRGQEWGILRGPFGNARTNPVTFQAVLKEIGLREWRRYRFVPYDVELVIAGLKKLGPVTPEQRLRIQANALDIMSKYHNHHETSEALQADLVAAVRELARRAPSAPHLGDLKPVQAST